MLDKFLKAFKDGVDAGQPPKFGFVRDGAAVNMFVALKKTVLMVDNMELSLAMDGAGPAFYKFTADDPPVELLCNWGVSFEDQIMVLKDGSDQEWRKEPEANDPQAMLAFKNLRYCVDGMVRAGKVDEKVYTLDAKELEWTRGDNTLRGDRGKEAMLLAMGPIDEIFEGQGEVEIRWNKTMGGFMFCLGDIKVVAMARLVANTKEEPVEDVKPVSPLSKPKAKAEDVKPKVEDRPKTEEVKPAEAARPAAPEAAAPVVEKPLQEQALEHVLNIETSLKAGLASVKALTGIVKTLGKKSSGDKDLVRKLEGLKKQLDGLLE